MKEKTLCVILSMFLLFSGCAPRGQLETADKPISDRTVLTLACGNDRVYPQALVDVFNESQDNYELQPMYYEGEDSLERKEQLLADIAAGRGPDIIHTDSFALSQGTIQVEEYMEDLRPYLDSDSELSWDDLVPAFVNAYAPTGKLYTTVSDFSVNAFRIRASMEETPMGYADFQTLFQQVGAENFEIYPSETGNTFLRWATYCCRDPLNGTMDYSGTNFTQALRLYKDLYSLESQDNVLNQAGTLYYGQLYTFSDLQFWRQVFGEDVVLWGLPGQTGGSFFSPVSAAFGINKNSQYKDVAWGFLRTLFTAEYQEIESVAFPTNQVAFSNMISAARKGTSECVSVPFEMDATYESVSQEDINTILAFINHTTDWDGTWNGSFDNNFYIIHAIVDRYAAGELTLEESIAEVEKAVPIIE